MNKMKLSRGKISLVLIILGVGCMSWAIFSIWTQSHYSGYVGPKTAIIPKTIVKEIVKAKSQNITTVKSDVSIATKSLYPVYPVAGAEIGSLTIPVLKRELPIFQGTGAVELKKGVGHFTQSVLPGEEDNCVISGHRDTVFRQLDKLKVGDKIIVKTTAGIFTYEVSGWRIVHANDKTVIVPTDKAVLTMTTCYPFNAIGDAPDRYIVSASLIKSK